MKASSFTSSKDHVWKWYFNWSNSEEKSDDNLQTSVLFFIFSKIILFTRQYSPQIKRNSCQITIKRWRSTQLNPMNWWPKGWTFIFVFLHNSVYIDVLDNFDLLLAEEVGEIINQRKLPINCFCFVSFYCKISHNNSVVSRMKYQICKNKTRTRPNPTI